MAIMQLKIEGMHCASCKILIEDVCKDIPGILSCSVDLEQGLATVVHDGTFNVSVLKNEVSTLGDYSLQEYV